MDPASRRGFTLVELLVVIAIIALLIAILLPSLGASRERAKSLVCRTQLRELGRSALAYATEHAKFPPCVDNYSWSDLDTDKPGLDWLGIGDQFGAFVLGDPNDPWTGNPKGFAAAPRYGLLWPYYRNERLVLCPAERPGDYVANQIVGAGNGKFSYTMVAGVALRAPERIPAASNVTGTMRQAASVPLFLEEHPEGINNLHREGNFWGGFDPPPDGGDKLVSRHGPFDPRRGIRPNDGGITTFLQGQTNIGFADGHVDGVRTNFGFGKNEAQQTGYTGVPNNVVGLMYRYGVAYDMQLITN